MTLRLSWTNGPARTRAETRRHSKERMPSPRNRQIDLGARMEEVHAVHVDTEGPSLTFADPRLRAGSRDCTVGAGDEVQQHFIAEMLHHVDLEGGRVFPALAVRKQMEVLGSHTEHDRGAA